MREGKMMQVAIFDPNSWLFSCLCDRQEWFFLCKGDSSSFTESIHLVWDREQYYRYVQDYRITPVSERKRRMVGAREQTENTAKTNGCEKDKSCAYKKQIHVELEENGL